MSKIFSNNYPVINLYKKSSYKSEMVSQMIYGESFRIISKSKKWLKIKIQEDKYIGYIKRKKFIFCLKSKFAKFQNKWIEIKNIKPLKYKDKDIFNDVKIFRNIKYKWGGKTFKGIDCSALVQVCLNFNNKSCPRDPDQQISFFKKNINLKNIKRNDIIYWKGHVAIALSDKKLIHAYGPKKKILVMGIKETVELIKKTANLKIIAVKRL